MSLFLEDSNGNGLAGVVGATAATLLSEGSTTFVATPGLTAGGGNVLEVAIANTANATAFVGVLIVGDDGSILLNQNFTLNAFRGTTVSVSITPPSGARCNIVAATNGELKQMRASLSVTSSGGGTSSASPLGNF